MDFLLTPDRIGFHVERPYRHPQRELEESEMRREFMVVEIIKAVSVFGVSHFTLSPGISPEGSRVTGGAIVNTGATS